MARRRGVRRYTNQAALEARARYGPQERALAQLLLDTQQQAQQQMKGIRGVAVVNQNAINQARPQITGAYKTADQVRGGAYQDVAPLLGSLGDTGVAGIIKAGIDRERAQATAHLTTARASNLSELALRKTAAAAGALGAVRDTALQAHNDTIKIGNQIAGLQGDKGAFVASTINSLQDADKKYGLQSRSAKRLERQTTAQLTGVDPVTGQLTPAGRKAIGQSTGTDPITGKPYGGKKPAGNKHRTKETAGSLKLKQLVMNASDSYQRYLQQGKSGAWIAHRARKQGVPDWALNAAADLAYHKYITPGHVKALRVAGMTHFPHAWVTPPRLPSVGQIAASAVPSVLR